MEKTIILLVMLLFTLYVLVSAIYFGVPSSLSETYYLYKKRLNKGWLFTLLMAIVGISMMISWLELSRDYNYQFIAFLSSAALVFVGFSPRFKEKLQGEVHYGSALISMLLALFWVLGINKDYVLFAIITTIFLSFYLGLKEYSKWLFWLEMVAFYSLFITFIK